MAERRKPVAQSSALEPNQVERKNNDALLGYGKLLKSKNIQQLALFKFSDSPEVKQRSEYPKTSDKRCLGCRKRMNGKRLAGRIPIHRPLGKDRKHNVWILDRFVHCSRTCAVDTIVKEEKANAMMHIGNLAHFLREFLQIDTPDPTYVAVGSVKDFCETGTRTMDEYYEASGKVVAVLRNPPHVFLDTWSEETDVDARRQRKVNQERLAELRSTPQEQEDYKNLLKRARESESHNKEDPNSTIGNLLKKARTADAPKKAAEAPPAAPAPKRAAPSAASAPAKKLRIN
jgi:hypothetical protein